MTNSDSIITILEQAAEIVLRPNGWCQGKMYDGEACCALGALWRARGGDENTYLDAHTNAVLVVSRCLLNVYGDSSIAYYNDHIAVTAENVAKMFRSVADTMKITRPLFQ